MSNGRCDICGAPAAYRVKMVENGFRKVKELCEEHYQELARQAGGRRGGFRSPLESMFGSSFFDDFFGGCDPFYSGVIGNEGGAPRSGGTQAQNLGDRESVDLQDYMNDEARELLQKAAARGNKYLQGIGILLYQAQKAFQYWYGILPEVSDALQKEVLSS